MLSDHLILAAAALALEAIVGYPDALYRAVGHPVTWMGALLAGLERRLNRADVPSRRLAGVGALVILLAAVAIPSVALEAILIGFWPGFLLLIVFAATLPAQQSLYLHVRAVADALEGGGLDAGRGAVSLIVGRDPLALDASGVARAAIESLAENFSDGIVAPAFWMALAGLPGAAVYKAANTADSMIGHRSERYRDFGWAAARFDDWVNLPASRLAALWLVLAALVSPGASTRPAIAAVKRDAPRHRSPNAGWPEAAMAGALGLKLAGPRVYAGVQVEDGYMGDGRRDANGADIRAALRLYRRACIIQMAALAALAMLWAL